MSSTSRRRPRRACSAGWSSYDFATGPYFEWLSMPTPVAPAEELLDDVAADEAGRAGDEHLVLAGSVASELSSSSCGARRRRATAWVRTRSGTTGGTGGSIAPS